VLGYDDSLSAFQQQADQLQFRWGANNYSIGEMRSLTMLTLSLKAR
jgi:hypothetical protein